MKRVLIIALALCIGVAPSAFGQTSWPNQREADFILQDSASAVVKRCRAAHPLLHARHCEKNAAGDIVNGVLLLHGTSGSERPGCSRHWPTSCLGGGSRSTLHVTS